MLPLWETRDTKGKFGEMVRTQALEIFDSKGEEIEVFIHQLSRIISWGLI